MLMTFSTPQPLISNLRTLGLWDFWDFFLKRLSLSRV